MAYKFPKITHYPNAGILNQLVCNEIINKIILLAEIKDNITIVLSGGSTPHGVFDILSNTDEVTKEMWQKIHFFWIDERLVPLSSKESNAGEAKRRLLDKVIPSQNLHVPRIELDANAAAGEYENRIKEFFANSPIVFDILLLGYGADGHIASIFPDSDEHKNPNLDALVFGLEKNPKDKHPRISFTYKGINFCNDIVIIGFGDEKKTNVVEKLENSQENDDLPIARVIQENYRKISWYHSA